MEIVNVSVFADDVVVVLDEISEDAFYDIFISI